MVHGNPALFRLFGFEVRLDPSWLLLAFLITWTLAAGLFPANYPELSHETYWRMGIAGALGVFLSIVLHELSHSLVARRYGLSIKGITLFIFGGVAELRQEPPNPKAEFYMALAGPIASFLLSVLFRLLHLLAQASDWPTSVVGVTDYLATINLVLALFNLAPAFPLDGGRMLRAGLWKWKQSLTEATRIASRIGAGFGVAMMLLGGFAFFRGNFIAGMWWFLIGLFLRGAATATYGQVIIRHVLHGEPIRRFMNSVPVVVSPGTTLQQFVEDYIYKYHFKLFPVVDGVQLVGCIHTQEVKSVPHDQWGLRTVGDLMTPCSPQNSVSPELDTALVLARMMRPDSAGRFMVVEHGRLKGIVSVKDLREFIRLKMDLEPPGS